eukprot:XP_014054985.1 PREDICTED: BTB/POZ domain-containing protein 18-like isoform X2 [Salmo salar]
MWRYQRPGFEALVLAELQRQQRCRQFCDTVLRAEGVSVPAHSCILSALSPQLSCALSTSPAPPSGQSHLLDFQAFGACTLMRLVGLLYSGEMVGEGERQKVISAATRLGIQGLVEVGKRDDKKEREPRGEAESEGGANRMQGSSLSHVTNIFPLLGDWGMDKLLCVDHLTVQNQLGAAT